MNETKRTVSRKNLNREQTLLLHGVGFVTGDPTIRLEYPSVMHPGTTVTVSEAGDKKWIYMMLPITRGSLITRFQLACHRTGLESHISLIRLIEQSSPLSATVVHNEPVGASIPSGCTIESACNVIAANSLLLKVCMEFANTDDTIEFGAVEVTYVPNFQPVKAGYHREREMTAKQQPYSLKPSAGYFLSRLKASASDFFIEKHKLIPNK